MTHRYVHTDAVITKALQGALDQRHRGITVDKNLCDAFTSRLLDAGVDTDELDLVFSEADIDKIDPDPDGGIAGPWPHREQEDTGAEG